MDDPDRPTPAPPASSPLPGLVTVAPDPGHDLALAELTERVAKIEAAQSRPRGRRLGGSNTPSRAFEKMLVREWVRSMCAPVELACEGHLVWEAFLHFCTWCVCNKKAGIGAATEVPTGIMFGRALRDAGILTKRSVIINGGDRYAGVVAFVRVLPPPDPRSIDSIEYVNQVTRLRPPDSIRGPQKLVYTYYVANGHREPIPVK